MTAIPTPPPLTPTDKTPVWEDLLEIFYAPTAVFERRAKDPKFFVTFAVVSVVIAVILFVGKGLLQPAFDAEFARGMAAAMKANPQLTADQMEKGRGIGAAFGTIFLLFGAPIGILFVGPITWLCGKSVGATEDIASAFMIAAYAYVPRMVGAVFLVVQPLLLPPEQVKGFGSLMIGPARFLDPDTSNKLLVLIATRLDLFTIWSTVIIAIGLRVTGKVPAAKAWTAAAIVWLIPALFGLIGVLRAK